MAAEETNEAQYGCIMPFWIDTDGYSDREREMFVCGFEFYQVYEEIKAGFSGKRPIPIHSENASRVRMMCAKLGCQAIVTRSCVEGWCELEVVR